MLKIRIHEVDLFLNEHNRDSSLNLFPYPANPIQTPSEFAQHNTTIEK